jgi:hypothetical protein
VVHVLGAHAGELARNDYGALVRARAKANRVLGAERVFGYGSAAREQPLAELLTEAVMLEGEWWAAPARELDPQAPLASPGVVDPGTDPKRAVRHRLGWWLNAESVGDRMHRER